MNHLIEFIAVNWMLVLALIVILVMLARTYIGPGASNGMGAMEVVNLINHKDAVVVDVRTDSEFQKGHILNSVHIPLGLFESRIQELDSFKSRPIVASCQSGNRSSRALSLLKKRGFTEVYNLTGGIMAWQNANLPLTTQATGKLKVKSDDKSDTEEKA